MVQIIYFHIAVLKHGPSGVQKKPSLYLHCWPATITGFGPMGLWLKRWPGEVELVPNITRAKLGTAFDTCLGTEPFWFKDRGYEQCEICGITLPEVVQANEHSYTKAAFGAYYQEIQPEGVMSLVYAGNAKSE